MDPALGSPTLTVLTTHGPLLAKRVTRKGTVGYDNARRFDVRPVAVDTLDELRDLLGTLAGNPQSALILETPDPAVPNPKGYRRQRYFDPMRHWLALDIDAAEAPPGMDPTGDDAVDFVLESLPEALRGVDCLPQFTASAGLKGNLIRMRVWFRLDAPMEASRLRLWARSHNAQPGALQIDEKLYSRVQVHYTADPIFEGVRNPFEGRSRLVPMRKAMSPSARVSVAALEAEIEAYEASAALSRENGSMCLSVALAGTWKAPACGWTGNAEDYLQDKPSGMGLHAAVNRLVLESAPRLGADPSKAKLQALASGIREAALSALSAGRLTGRTRDYVLAETSLEAVSRSYRGAVARGAALRTPENAATGADAALKDARNAAAGKPRVPGYAPQEWLHHAVQLMLPRLGPLTPEALLAMAEARTGIKPDRGTRDMVQRHWGAHRAAYRRDHRLGSPHYEVERIQRLEDIEIEPGSVIVIKAGFGTGKTVGTVTRLQRRFGHCAVISHRETLAIGASVRFGIESYKKSAEGFDSGLFGGDVSLCINSISKPHILETLRETQVIVVDEAEQVRRHLAGEITKSQAEEIIEALRELFPDPGKTIMLLDAGMDARAALFWHSLTQGKPLHVYEKPVEARGVLNLHRETGGKDTRAAVLAGALEALGRGVRPVVATDTQKGAVALAEALTERGYRVGLVTGRRQDEQTKRAFASDPEAYPKEQGWDALVYSPAVAAGVSLESGYFGAVFGLYTGVVSPADFLQQLFRVRTVAEYTVAVVSRGSPAPLPERNRADALESLAGERLDDVSRLLLRIDTANARDLQAYGVKFCAAAEDAGLRVERIGGDSDLEPLALELREITESIRARGVSEVLDAPVLEPGEADRLKRARKSGETLSVAEALALDRWHCCELLRIEDPQALSADDVWFVQKHKNANEIIHLFALAVALMLDPERDLPEAFNDPDTRPLVLRRYLLPKGCVFADLLAGLGVDPPTGAGIWKLPVAAGVLAQIAEEHRDVLVAMGFRPEKWGSRTTATVRALLDRIGLRVKVSGHWRNREYQIDPESWARMVAYSARTGALALTEGPLPVHAFFDELPPEDDDDDAPMPEPLPVWVRDCFGRTGFALADWRWITETMGVSRRTAFSRKAELAGIDVAGVRRFTVGTPESSVEGITRIDDIDRLKALLTRALGGAVVRLAWAEPPQEECKLVQIRQSCIYENVLSAPICTPSTPTPGRPAQGPAAPVTAAPIQRRGCLLRRWATPDQLTEPLTPTAPMPRCPVIWLNPTGPDPDAPITRAEVIRARGLTPGRARRSTQRGKKMLRKFGGRSHPLFAQVQRDTEAMLLFTLALGESAGDINAAGRWVAEATRAVRNQRMSA